MQTFIYSVYYVILLGGTKNVDPLNNRKQTTMYKKDGEHKSTAMDSFSAPRAEGLIPQVLNNFGFAQSDKGRFSAGLKYDFVRALANVSSVAGLSDELVALVGGETARLQSERRKASKRVTLPDTPEAAVAMLRAEGMSLDDVKAVIAMVEAAEKKG